MTNTDAPAEHCWCRCGCARPLAAHDVEWCGECLEGIHLATERADRAVARGGDDSGRAQAITPHDPSAESLRAALSVAREALEEIVDTKRHFNFLASPMHRQIAREALEKIAQTLGEK